MPTGPVKKPPRFGGPRVRSFAPKSRGGCITCKKRRVKCGEEKPSCSRCLLGNRECEGYDDSTSKTTSDSPPDGAKSGPGSDSGYGDDDGDVDYATELIHRPRICRHCGDPHESSMCPSAIMPSLVRPSSSPYRQKTEQYLFKFFVEVAAASVSRSNISAYYWLGHFPQVAHDTSSVRDCLLAVSAAFHSTSGAIFTLNTDASMATASCIAYEGRAMRALSRGNPSTSEVLNTSMAFWITSMVMGDWGLALQHLYYCLKIIRGLPDRSKFDPLQLRYQEALASIGLKYFRTTRGPCLKHGSGDFLECEVSCYTPEDRPFTDRAADALHHLKIALPVFELCLKLLRDRLEPHSHQAELDAILNKEIREVRFLVNSWSDQARMKMDDVEWSAVQARGPYTISPFDTVLADLIRYIVNDQHSTGIVFQELELRTRVSIVHIVSATSRGNSLIMEDSLALMYYSGYTEGLLRTKGNWSNTHIEELMRAV